MTIKNIDDKNKFLLYKVNLWCVAKTPLFYGDQVKNIEIMMQILSTSQVET